MYRDLVFYNNLMRLTSWFGITPFWFETKRSISLLWANICATILLLLSMLTVLWCHFPMLDFGNDLIFLLNIIQFLMDYLPLGSCLLTTIIHRRGWRIVLEKFEQFHEKNPLIEYGSRASLYSAIVTLASGGCFLTWFTWWCVCSMETNLLIIVVITCLSEFMTIFQCVTLDIVSTCYKILAEHLKFIVARKKLDSIDQELRDLSVQCGIIHRIAAQLNILFGWPILFATIKSILVILNSVSNLFTKYFERSTMTSATVIEILTAVVSTLNFEALGNTFRVS